VTLCIDAATSEVRDALAATLARRFGPERRVRRLERRASAYRSSFGLEELDLELEDGTNLHLMLKDMSRGALAEETRQLKPVFLYDPRREIETYRQILASEDLGTPGFYGAVTDRALGRWWLLIERIEGRELYQIGDFGVWRHAARWLAELHRRFAAAGASLASRVPLVRYDRRHYEVWLSRALELLRDGTSSEQAALREIAARYDTIVERLLALPVTVIHGEFYASNILVQENASGCRIAPVDWEVAGLGPGLIDLAALIAGNWTESEKQQLASAYDPRVDDAALRCCRLFLAVQWLGWWGRRRPAPQHAQDWLGEALRLAEELEP
jgi:hypothetical protein